jgi:hypothetical protein
MKRARKTIDVAHIREWVNAILMMDDYDIDHKRGMIDVLEHVLRETNNYHGFGYYDTYDPDTWNDTKEYKRFYHT